METRHFKLDYEEAISAKKNLLTSELDLLHILKRIRTYKILRKKEIAERNKLKIHIGNLKARFNLLASTFPADGPIKVRKKMKTGEKKDSVDLRDELEDIKRKLDKLS